MNKTSKIILAVVVVIALAAALVVMSGSKPDKSKATSNSESTKATPETPAANDQTEQPAAKEEVAATITYSNDGFSPSSVTVNSGDKIKFTNSSDSVAAPSSNPHPVHTDNPELNVGDIQPGDSRTITVATKGTWGMHNHYNPSQKVTVIVK